MHLLVLSAFRLKRRGYDVVNPARLNAPFGAQCFPTNTTWKFWRFWAHVSMHLLVLSAFRRDGVLALVRGSRVSQCTFWCSVLSDPYAGDFHDR